MASKSTVAYSYPPQCYTQTLPWKILVQWEREGEEKDEEAGDEDEKATLTVSQPW